MTLLKDYIKYFLFLFLISGVFYYLIVPIFQITNQPVYIFLIGHIIETFILSIIVLILLIVFKRKRLALVLAVLFYFIFLAINIIKIRYLSMPLYPVDFQQLGNLVKTWDLFKTFIPYAILILVIVSLIIWLGYCKEAPSKEVKNKSFYFNHVFLLLLISSFFIFNNEISMKLREQGIFHKKNSHLPRRCLKYGFLTNFFQASLFIQTTRKPERYSKNKIQNIVNKYNLNQFNNTNNKEKPDNIILLLAESYTDPSDFGWKFTQEPIPVFNKNKLNQISGTVHSPVYGGKSTNAEFEILTGLTNRFTPIETMPYEEFAREGVSSLAKVLNFNGFNTNAIQVIKFKGFGYGKIYDYLEFNNKISLSKDKNLELDPSNKTTSSREIAKKIINLTKEQKASFIFAFPNSSHSPWYIKDYPNTMIHLENTSLSKGEEEIISAYANSINHIDLLYRILINEYSNSPRKTLIILLGDHQPGIPNYTKNYIPDLRYNEYINDSLKKYRTPIQVWSNYLTSNNLSIEISVNFLPSYILDIANLKYKGFFKFNNLLRNVMPVFSKVILDANKSYTDHIPEEFDEMVKDYKLLQYDILFGENYIYKLTN